MKSLLIVESPAKVKTLSKFLGKDFTIKASIGHVKDLPERELGVDVENNFKPTYVVIEGKERVLKELKKAAKNVDRVFLGPDPDREGEAIAWHIAEELNGNSDRILRVEFNEITERAVTEAIKRPRRINMNLVNAQQARRVLDRLVGYKLSPLLWRKVRRGLSAGRVQSVALRLVVDREREIEAFKSEEYWSVTATLKVKDESESEKNKSPFNARLFQINGQKADIKNEAEAKGIVEDLADETFTVKKVDKKKRKRSPTPPFITSTLQQEASRKLKLGAKKTMLIAQRLYEGLELGAEGSVGLITYMRTDSVRVAAEAQEEARKFIIQEFGNNYAPQKLPMYKSKKTAQEGHEAIRPTSVFRTPHSVKNYLAKDEYQLYNLIWNRFVASQMSVALLEQTTVTITVNRDREPLRTTDTSNGHGLYEFRATGTVVEFPGFMALYTEGVDEVAEDAKRLEEVGIESYREGMLPPLGEGDILKPITVLPKQHFTQPPPRYTEATLVKELEAKGIGRPSTYATILSTLQERKYVEKSDDRFKPIELGMVVNDLLVERFSDVMDYNFTARMESDLDKIEEGLFKWFDVVIDFYKPFDKDLLEAMKELGRVRPQDIPIDKMCKKCGKPMVIKWGKHGRFIACSGFPECKNTKPLKTTDHRPVPSTNSGQALSEVEGPQTTDMQQTDEKCEKCGSPMVLKSGRFGKFLACSRYPECRTSKPLGIGIKCPEDGGEIVERKTKKGKIFFSCSNYPECKFATWYRPVSKSCPKCGVDILVGKRTKKEKALVCLRKDCGYKEEL
jgi:DNA topoisomerase-1